MVLLHFWSLDCVYCPGSIPKLVEFQRKWGGKGLQVVSVLHDEGDLGRRKQGVLNVATRYETRYNFPVLFSGRDCPVRKTIGVHAYPTFILLDEAGRIKHRCEGLNEINRLDIEAHLKRGLPK
jgi:thiol-disulfide isomerase/thioredoxin